MRVGNLTSVWFKDIKPNGIARLRYHNSRYVFSIGFSLYFGLYVWRVDYIKRKYKKVKH